jgi:integrase
MSRVGALWSWVQRRETRSAIEERRDAVAIHSPLDPETRSRDRARRDRWLTREEATALFAVAPPRLRFAVAAGLFAGLRIGEILHLRTHVDIDLELGTITVSSKQIGVDDQGAPVMWHPKTKRSARVVPIGPDLKPIVEEHIATFASSDWMMPAIEDPGVPFAYITFRNHFQTIVADAELVTGRKDPRGVVFHSLRHTFASWLVMAGIDLYTVAQLLGDTLQMVEDTYAHLAPDFKRRAIEALKGAIVIGKPATESTTSEAISMGTKRHESYPDRNSELAGNFGEIPELPETQPYKEGAEKPANRGNGGFSEVLPQEVPQVVGESRP